MLVCRLRIAYASSCHSSALRMSSEAAKAAAPASGAQRAGAEGEQQQPAAQGQQQGGHGGAPKTVMLQVWRAAHGAAAARRGRWQRGTCTGTAARHREAARAAVRLAQRARAS